MIIIDYLYYILSGVIILFLTLPFWSVLFSLLFSSKKQLAPVVREFDMGCIITAYKNAEIAKPLIHSLLNQNYSRHMIYLVADACDLTGWDLKDERLVVLHPESPLNLKAKSIIYGMEHFTRKHEYVVVFDADNLAHPQFLPEINRYANAGYTCIQGQRTAKNLDSVYACADATGEFYKNYVERVVPSRIGSSSVISGSGMAVEYNLYKSYLDSPAIQQGKELWKKMLQEDKILQNHIVGKNGKITYAWDAIVYDEKVSSAQAVETQRSRWLFSYFQNIPNSSGMLLRGLFRLQFNSFYFGLMTISPPLFILLFGACFLTLIGLFLNMYVSAALFVAIMIFIGNIFLSLYLSRVPKVIWTTIWGIPLFIIRQVVALLKMGNPNKNFKHSEHNRTVYIDEILRAK